MIVSMMMLNVNSVPLVIAQAGPSPNLLMQLLPFAMMLGIFYLLVLMPMRKRQKKVAEFQAGLKVGDKVITTGGLFGEVTRVDDGTNSVQVQIADRGRVQVSRAAVAGYQGEEPVVKQDGGGGI
jgi:preprotein translocase subunit YajC